MDEAKTRSWVVISMKSDWTVVFSSKAAKTITADGGGRGVK